MVSSNKGLVNDHEQLLSSGGAGRLENVGSFLPSAGMTSFVPLVLAETSANKIETTTESADNSKSVASDKPLRKMQSLRS